MKKMSNYNSDYSSYYSTPNEEYNNNNNNINGENESCGSTNSELLPSTFADTSSEIQRPKFLTSEEIEDAKKGEKILGLQLNKTPSFLNKLNLLSGATCQTDDSFVSADRLPAVNFSAFSIIIGSWTKIARHGGQLIVRCYFKKRQLVWEVLIGNRMNKIEFLWSNIAAIKATFHPNAGGVLDIMLENPPLFLQEVNPRPKKSTKWEQCGDFTEQQQASIIRKHTLVFFPGVLEKHYNKIIQSDPKLYFISQQPFPNHASMYFNEIHFSNQLISSDNHPLALPPQIPSVMNFSGHSMSNSPSNITTISSGYNPGYHHGLSSTNNEQPYDTNDQPQSIVSSANLGTTHQQAGYVHSSSVHATMENNIGQYTLGDDQSQSIVSSANLGTTHQQAGYVHSSSVHAATMENNTGQDPLGYQNSMQQMTQLGDNTLDHSSHDAGGNQNQN